MRKYCLALDLKNDEKLIRAYEDYHRKVWPEVLDSLRDSGIEHMQIYRLSNRLFMIIEVSDHFSFEKKAEMDSSNPKVQEWEELMWNYQQALPTAAPGEKWMLMEKIFEFPVS
ncbi:L-rhamnose mutarotase [Poritiphilus flavus]|uniref:L-rhamnose mutarotase n=1 Tax=Poritiphilus flavus TaxID=2697053 RepID=UPI001EECC624|nr:L-rhamnose mutarotase [Poritiphilus flavus]